MLTKILSYLAVTFFAISILFFGILYASIPDVSKLSTCFTTSMKQVNFCKTSPNYIKIKNIPEDFIHTLLVSEDASFFYHGGLDYTEIKNSISQNLESGKRMRGASTISQQLVKNAFLSNEKTYWRKLVEAITTYRLEEKYSKEEILEFYLNMVEFGEDIYGLKRASSHYFNKNPEQLSLVEGAYLVQLLPNPILRSQNFFGSDLSERVLDRMKGILKNLQRYNRIQHYEYMTALREMQAYPWFDENTSEVYIDSIADDVNSDLEEESLEEEMYKVY